jgi:hypothetical protein
LTESFDKPQGALNDARRQRKLQRRLRRVVRLDNIKNINILIKIFWELIRWIGFFVFSKRGRALHGALGFSAPMRVCGCRAGAKK